MQWLMGWGPEDYPHKIIVVFRGRITLVSRVRVGFRVRFNVLWIFYQAKNLSGKVNAALYISGAYFNQ